MTEQKKLATFALSTAEGGKWRLKLDDQAYIDFDNLADAKRQQAELRRLLAEQRSKELGGSSTSLHRSS